ncbi:hypothetical protein [Magnetospira thiophila]
MALRSQIGLWWIIDGIVVPSSIPFDTCAAIEGWRDTPNGHFQHWRNLQRTRPELLPHEFTDFERGRVLYHEPSKTFVIYGSRNLLRHEEKKAQIVRAFDLPPGRFRFVADSHYEKATPIIDNLD